MIQGNQMSNVQTVETLLQLCTVVPTKPPPVVFTRNKSNSYQFIPKTTHPPPFFTKNTPQ